MGKMHALNLFSDALSWSNNWAEYITGHKVFEKAFKTMLFNNYFEVEDKIENNFSSVHFGQVFWIQSMENALGKILNLSQMLWY